MGYRLKPKLTKDQVLAWQSLAFLCMLGLPLLLYLAAASGATAWVMLLLGLLAAVMVLSMWVS